MNLALLRGTTPLLVLVLLATSLPAQDDPQARVRIEPVRAMAYPLENAFPNEVAGLLSNLFTTSDRTVRVTSDERTRTVVVFGPESTHRHVRELLETLDQRVESEGSALETRIIALQHHPADGLYSVVRMHEVQSAINPATNSFIVRGTGSEIDRLAASLAKLDVPRTSVQLECWVLEQGKGDPVEGHSDLAPLAPELTRAGLTGYGILSHMQVASLAGETFQSIQSFQEKRVRTLSLEGSVRLVDEGRTAQIAFGLSLHMLLGKSEQNDSSGSFEIQTELRTEPGKLVIVGLAPTGDENSKPLVLVLRVGS